MSSLGRLGDVKQTTSPESTAASTSTSTVEENDGHVKTVNQKISHDDKEIRADNDKIVQDDDNVCKMDEFFKTVSSTKQDFNEILKLINQIEKAHQVTLDHVTAGKKISSNNKLEKLMTNATNLFTKSTNTLKKIDLQNRQLEVNPNIGPSHPNLRVRFNQYQGLLDSYMKLLHQYQDVQEKYKSKYSQQFERQMKIVNPKITSEELDQMIQYDTETLMTQQVFSTELNEKIEAKKIAAQVKERHQNILLIEKSIVELNQLFIEMNLLIDQQADLNDQIEQNVSRAQNYVEKAGEEIRAAVRHQRNRTKVSGSEVIMKAVVVSAILFSIF